MENQNNEPGETPLNTPHFIETEPLPDPETPGNVIPEGTEPVLVDPNLDPNAFLLRRPRLRDLTDIDRTPPLASSPTPPRAPSPPSEDGNRNG